MKSSMDLQQHHQCVRRAIALGRSQDPASLSELVGLLKMPSAEIRRLAASAIGKLSGFGVEPTMAVEALVPVAKADPHPQVRQYALKALKAYGAAAEIHLDDLRDIAENPEGKDYVRSAAASAADIIAEAAHIRDRQAVHTCFKCALPVAADEYARSQKAFQRTYCDRCFDEVFLKRRNWETQVELNKTIQAANGTVVQSDGERIIAEELAAMGLVFRYDNRFRIIKGYAIRPDFYLPEFDLYIEYWGMEDNLDYQIGMMEKKKLYQQSGKKLVSLYAREKSRLREALREKLALYIHLPQPEQGGSEVAHQPATRNEHPHARLADSQRTSVEINEERIHPQERTVE